MNEMAIETDTYLIDNNGCWNWKKAFAGHLKYGVISFYKRNYYLHRLSYRLFKGEIPNDKLIMHACDNPKCFNPNHLSLGTPKMNVDDMYKKGRNRDIKGKFVGEKNANCKYSNEECSKMIQQFNNGIPIKIIRHEFGISAAQFYRIRKGIRK